MAKTLDPTGKLTDKQALFVREYTLDFNATAAAIRAGYSPATAYSIGQENLTKPQVDEAIRALLAERARRLDISGERVLQGLAQIAFANICEFIEITPDGLARVDLSKMDAASAGGVAQITSDTLKSDGREVVRTRVKLGNKLGALHILARYLKLTGGSDRHADEFQPIQLVIVDGPHRPAPRDRV